MRRAYHCPIESSTPSVGSNRLADPKPYFGLLPSIVSRKLVPPFARSTYVPHLQTPLDFLLPQYCSYTFPYGYTYNLIISYVRQGLSTTKLKYRCPYSCSCGLPVLLYNSVRQDDLITTISLFSLFTHPKVGAPRCPE